MAEAAGAAAAAGPRGAGLTPWPAAASPRARGAAGTPRPPPRPPAPTAAAPPPGRAAPAHDTRVSLGARAAAYYSPAARDTDLGLLVVEQCEAAV